MGLRSRMMAGFAAQLGNPTGFRGRLVGRMLNRANRGMIANAVDALAPRPGDTAADLGFGGGVGLALLLERVGPQGRVLGIDLSQTMVDRAARRFKREIASGRLRVETGSMTDLPLEDGAVQGAITLNTVYFIEELERAFSELARILARPGKLVVGIGDPEMMAALPTTPYGFRIRPVDEVVAIAARAGLTLGDHRRAGPGERAGHLLVFSR
jgi:arsenite methyltransferase